MTTPITIGEELKGKKEDAITIKKFNEITATKVSSHLQGLRFNLGSSLHASSKHFDHEATSVQVH